MRYNAENLIIGKIYNCSFPCALNRNKTYSRYALYTDSRSTPWKSIYSTLSYPSHEILQVQELTEEQRNYILIAKLRGDKEIKPECDEKTCLYTPLCPK